MMERSDTHVPPSMSEDPSKMLDGPFLKAQHCQFARSQHSFSAFETQAELVLGTELSGEGSPNSVQT